jgi:hypothetical protein
MRKPLCAISIAKRSMQRCTPLHFSAGMAGAVAGHLIAIRFVDERATDTDSGK